MNSLFDADLSISQWKVMQNRELRMPQMERFYLVGRVTVFSKCHGNMLINSYYLLCTLCLTVFVLGKKDVQENNRTHRQRQTSALQ